MLGSCDICKGAEDLGGGGLGRGRGGKSRANLKASSGCGKQTLPLFAHFPRGFFRSSVVEFETSLSERNTKVMWILRVAKNQRLFKE